MLVLVCEGWFVILRSDPQRARERAVAEDPGRVALLAVAFGASVISLVAAVVVITQAQKVAPDAPAWLRTTLGLTAIIGAWTLLHTAFTLHYARLYYADPDMTESLEFRGGPPDDADFAYFAFGIGMTFQIPDVNVTTRQMRRVVLFHQLSGLRLQHGHSGTDRQSAGRPPLTTLWQQRMGRQARSAPLASASPFHEPEGGFKGGIPVRLLSRGGSRVACC